MIEPAEVVVRPERPMEEGAVRAVNDAAFGGPTEGRIVDALRGTDGWIVEGSLVAEASDGTIVGHLLLSKGDLVSDHGATRRIWLVGPVGVRPEHQRQGIGGALMHAAIRLAIGRGQPLLCLLGHPEYYPRFGFEPARAIGIEPPHPWGDAQWMALRLPAWDETWRGTVRYPPAFEI